MRRRLARLAVLGVLLLAGLASALLALPGPGLAGSAATTASSTGDTATTSTASTSTVSSSTVSTSTTPTPSTTTSVSPTTLVLSGHGWGHGLGMSQWGAYGYALHGWTPAQILAHYYTGTTLGTSPGATLRVLLVQGKRVALAAGAPWTITDAAGTKIAVDAAAVLKLTAALVVDGKQLRSPLTLTSAEPLFVRGRSYRGRLTITSDGTALQVIDVVGIEAYLKAVVPSEVPSKWPAAALEAQAVAARSYALANRQPAEPFDLYADTRSQVYDGVAAEADSTSAAVAATKGQVVLYGGQVADTLFFSTSGGRTASAADEIGKAVPYLVPVDDPYDVTSPVHDWGPVLVPGAAVAKVFKLSGDLRDFQIQVGSDGRARSATAVDSLGGQATVSAAALRAALGLRSTWLTSALLQLQPKAQTMTYGGAVSLTGFARDPTAAPVKTQVSLEARSAGVPWGPAGSPTFDDSGGFALIVKPQTTTQYRLAWGDIRAGLARIAVAPLVRPTVSAAGVTGDVRPVVAGGPVQLQQQSGSTWTSLSSTTVDSAGAWSFTGPLSPGTYRVRSAPGHGLVPGVSPPFEVQ